MLHAYSQETAQNKQVFHQKVVKIMSLLGTAYKNCSFLMTQERIPILKLPTGSKNPDEVLVQVRTTKEAAKRICYVTHRICPAVG